MGTFEEKTETRKSGLANRRLQPLGHLSRPWLESATFLSGSLMSKTPAFEFAIHYGTNNKGVKLAADPGDPGIGRRLNRRH